VSVPVKESGLKATKERGEKKNPGLTSRETGGTHPPGEGKEGGKENSMVRVWWKKVTSFPKKKDKKKKKGGRKKEGPGRGRWGEPDLPI